MQALLSDFIDWNQECRLILTKLTTHQCIKKKQETLLIYSEQLKNQACHFQPDGELVSWEGELSEGSVVRMQAEQVELFMQDFSATGHEALQLSKHTWVIHLPGHLDARLNSAGAASLTVLC